MDANIKEVSGKVTFLKKDGMTFKSLTEFFEIIRKESEFLPQFVYFYGLASDSHTYQVVLDFNMFSEQNISIDKIKFSQFQKYIGEILVEKKYITQEKLNAALKMKGQSLYNERLGELLVRLGYVTSDQIILALDEQLGLHGSGK